MIDFDDRDSFQLACVSFLGTIVIAVIAVALSHGCEHGKGAPLDGECVCAETPK